MPATDLDNLNEDMEVGAPYEEYEAPSNSFRPPDPGEYTFLRSTEQDLDWGRTKNGDIWTPVRFTIQGGDFNNRNVFSTLSTFVGKYRRASSVQDFLVACGSDAQPENGSRFTVREIKEIVDQTFGPFDAYISWEAYCPNCYDDRKDRQGKVVLKSHKDFPTTDEGVLLHEVKCPYCGTRISARAVLKRYIIR